jgi:hypothetical protein
MNAAKHNALMFQRAKELLARQVMRNAQRGVSAPVAARVLARLFASEA